MIDLLALRGGRVAAPQGDDVPVVLFDALDDETLAEVGRVIWEQRGDGVFSASSSGLGDALVAHWQRVGLLAERVPAPPLRDVDRIAVVSGSCSPVTRSRTRTV